MAASFKTFFGNYYYKVRSKYDLYFLYQILHEVMKAFINRNEEEVSDIIPIYTSCSSFWLLPNG